MVFGTAARTLVAAATLLVGSGCVSYEAPSPLGGRTELDKSGVRLLGPGGRSNTYRSNRRLVPELPPEPRGAAPEPAREAAEPEPTPEVPVDPLQAYVDRHPELDPVVARSVLNRRISLGIPAEALELMIGRGPDRVLSLGSGDEVRMTWIYEPRKGEAEDQPHVFSISGGVLVGYRQ